VIGDGALGHEGAVRFEEMADAVSRIGGSEAVTKEFRPKKKKDCG